jgi:hypothetical protein
LLFGLLVLSASAQAAAPAKPTSTRWERRVRLVWRTHAWRSHTRAEQREAEKAILTEGKAPATAALRPMLRRPLEDPLRLQAAFTMALLDLDYQAGRATLLLYLRALAVDEVARPEVNWDRLDRAVADPEAPEGEREVDPTSIADFVYEVYQRRGDPQLLTEFLKLAPHADGDLAEGMGVMLLDLARTNPRALLAGLSHKSPKVWDSVSDLAGFELGSEVSLQRALPKLYRISRSRRDPLRMPAQRLLRGLAAGQKLA